MSVLNGIVKNVLSGDTIVVMGKSSGGPPPEKTITLSHIIAPRFSNKEEQPFGFAAREALRVLAIGKEVTVRIEAPQGGQQQQNREFGTVSINGRDLSTEMAARGLVRSKATASEEVKSSETQAKAQQLGVFGPQAPIPGTTDRYAGVEGARTQTEVEGKTVWEGKGSHAIPVVVEYVSSGHSVKVMVVATGQVFAMSLTGVQCGVVKREGDKEVAQPYAREARFFTECRVLGRDAIVVLEGADKYGNAFGTLRFEGGNLGEELLKNGLAKTASWSIGATPTAAALRAAEKVARDARLRVWKDYTPSAAASSSSSSGSAKELSVRVVEILAADSVVVAGEDGKERKVFLSNVRVPKLGRRDEKPAPWAYEAREYVRKTLIGRKVKMIVDHVKPASDGYPEKTCVSIFTEKGVNVGESLVKQGLATVAKLKQDSEERGIRYDDLVAAEGDAQASKRGVHSSSQAPQQHFNEVSETPAKAKTFLPFLVRTGKVKAVVDYVFSGSRVKVSVPKESASFILSLAGVRAPHAARKEGDKAEPFGNDAYNLVRNAALQRDVDIEVYDVDKTGCFIGGLVVEGKTNLAVLLLELGLAKTSYLDRVPYAAEATRAEAQAKRARLRVWEGYVEPVDEPVDDADGGAATGARPVKTHKITVTEIVSGTRFFVHVDPDATARAIREATEAALATSAAQDGFRPNRNSYVLAIFPGDGEWYRARVIETNKDSAKVFFIDYGNTDEVPLGTVRPLPAASVASLPAQATEVELAHIRARPADDDDFGTEAALFTREQVWGKELSAVIEGKVEGVMQVTVSDGPVVVNNELVRAGLATVKSNTRGAREDRIKSLMEDQEIAKRGRINLWQYGDPGDDEDAKEFGWRK